LFNSNINGRKLGFNTPLRDCPVEVEFTNY